MILAGSSTVISLNQDQQGTLGRMRSKSAEAIGRESMGILVPKIRFSQSSPTLFLSKLFSSFFVS
jgi:hypothetical protein